MRCIVNGLLVVLATVLMSSLSACNTAEGFGRDLERAGEKIQESV